MLPASGQPVSERIVKETSTLLTDLKTAFNTIGEKVRSHQILAALKDPKSWAFVVIQFGIATGIGTVGVYLPSFILGFGLSPCKLLSGYSQQTRTDRSKYTRS